MLKVGRHTVLPVTQTNNAPDIHLCTTSPSSKAPIARDARLHFLSIIDLARIPLYIATGPSLGVESDNVAAVDWFSDVLLSGNEDERSNGVVTESWWLGPTRQSECGILLKVEDGRRRGDDASKATEIVLYAAVETSESMSPTPAASSSPAFDPGASQPIHSAENKIRLYALPLSSGFIQQAQQVSGLYSPPPELEGQAYFIPESIAKEDLGAKRQKITSLLNDATRQRKQLKGRGGESVAQAMASIDRAASQHLKPAPTHGAPLDQKPDATLSRSKSFSRASSMSSLALDCDRPASRSVALAQGKRSSLHRVERVFSQHEGFKASESDDVFAERNKAALAKVVMSGMRLHGLQQKKKSGKDTSSSGLCRSASLLGGNDTTHQDSEDEYKLVYHQTYKAALFAIRAHCNIRLVSQETMRDIVDQLLDLFCTDPASSILQHDDFPQGFVSQQQDCGGAFDLPSSSAPQDATNGCWSTPATKKRKSQNPPPTEPG
ncbi:MAG: hypothetical protein Q9217_002768 [Psora testacea]